jgi:hypothetical protein
MVTDIDRATPVTGDQFAKIQDPRDFAGLAPVLQPSRSLATDPALRTGWGSEVGM